MDAFFMPVTPLDLVGTPGQAILTLRNLSGQALADKMKELIPGIGNWYTDAELIHIGERLTDASVYAGLKGSITLMGWINDWNQPECAVSESKVVKFSGALDARKLKEATRIIVEELMHRLLRYIAPAHKPQYENSFKQIAQGFIEGFLPGRFLKFQVPVPPAWRYLVHLLWKKHSKGRRKRDCTRILREKSLCK